MNKLSRAKKIVNLVCKELESEENGQSRDGGSKDQPRQVILQESADKGAVSLLNISKGKLVASISATVHQKPSEPADKFKEEQLQIAPQESTNEGAFSNVPMLEISEGELVASISATEHQKLSELGGKFEEQLLQILPQESADEGALSNGPMLEISESELVAPSPVADLSELGSNTQEQLQQIEPQESLNLATSSAASLDLQHHNNGYELQPVIEVENDMNSTNIVSENEGNEGEGLPSTGRKSRKRKRNPENWKKNMKKSLKNTGKAYKTVTGKTVPAKEVKPPCGEKCRLKCSQKIDEFDRNKLFQSFWNIGDLGRQRQYVHNCMQNIKPKYSLHNENSKRSLNVAYFFNIDSKRIKVCKKFFSGTLDIGHSFLSTASKKAGPTGVIEEDNRGKHGNLKKCIAEVDKDAVREHINSYPRKESHYCRASSSKTYLDGDLNLCMMYRQYKEWCDLNNKSIVKQWAYDHIFQTEFNIAFHKPKKDQCSLCLSYNNAVGEDKAKLCDSFYRHLREKELCRQEKKADIESCKNDASKIVCCFDMQAVLQTPSGNDSLFFYKRRLNVYNCTVYNIVTKQAHSYLWNESLGGKGCDEVGTCILKFLENHAAGKHVIFYTDNCAAQNKNKYLMSLYYYAMKELNVKSITHKYLIVGHTQNEGDSVHSTIEREKTRILKNGSIFVPSQWVSVIQCARKKGTPYQVHELDFTDIVDLKNLLPQYGKNFTFNTDGDRVVWNDIKKIFMQVSSPYLIFYHDTYEPTGTMKIIDVRQKARRMPVTELQLRKKYHERPKISHMKKKDLLALCDSNVIPRVYREYYCKLEATNNRLSDGEDDD